MTKLTFIALFLLSLCLCDRQLDIQNLTRTIYSLAHQDGKESMHDVASTIVNSYNLNRASMGDHDWTKILQIGYKEGFNSSEPHPIIQADIDALQYAKQLATEIVDLKLKDSVNGATHFANFRDKYRNKERPGVFVFLFKRGPFYFWRQY
jgi:transcription antitermination factor NusG